MKLDHFGADSELHKSGFDYMYDMENSIKTYEDGPTSTQSEFDLKNYNVINQIEYIDYTLQNNPSNFFVKQDDSNLVSLKRLLSVCIDAAKSGGAQLISVRRNFDLKKIWGVLSTEQADNPVVVGRKRSLQAITHKLKHSFPNIKKSNGFKVEPYEGRIQIDNVSNDVLVPSNNILIWVDSLDAEREYHYNLLDYVTTMVCVAVKGQPVIGIIHQPFENFTKWGWVGNGISRDPYPVASEPHDVSRPLSIIISPRHFVPVKSRIKLSIGYEIDMIAAYGAGYKVLQVTEGKADALFHVNDVKKWKICAGNAIMNAENGKFTNVDGSNIEYGDSYNITHKRGIIASILDHDTFLKLTSFEIFNTESA
ncbi:putative inositol monophosphatase 3 [Caerostris extrusa]|uniref:inositol-phosphate phosphatase n=1 Tax=Caerostris extrusa TaxID=172846 RepID=A0AAV4QGT7_CAEEX|nr:putative inositol monophosphatase 3 [Caerostris extrusa]